MVKKTNQLGVNPSTAAHRLRTDILFAFVKEKGCVCFRCGGELTRETFSIDHKVPWLDTEDPRKAFFDLDNIAFSHKSCNYGEARRPEKGNYLHGNSGGYNNGCRCLLCKEWKSKKNKKRIRKPL